MKNIKINSPEICETVFRQIWDSGKMNRQERVYVLYLDKNHCVIDYEMLNAGNYSNAYIDLRSLLYSSIEKNVYGIVLAHNHPSGGLQPSKDDITTTLNIKTILSAIHVELFDHIILAPRGYYSMRVNKLLN